MICETCRHAFIREWAYNEDTDTINTSITCMIDGGDLEGPPSSCNRYELNFQKWTRLKDFWLFYSTQR